MMMMCKYATVLFVDHGYVLISEHCWFSRYQICFASRCIVIQ